MRARRAADHKVHSMSKPDALPSDHGPTAFTIIKPQHGLLQIDFREIWRYRDLIPVLARRDLKAEFSQTVLGPLWFVLHPVMQAVIFSLIFGALAKISTDGATPFLFYNASLVMWTYFTNTSTYVSNVFLTSAGLFGKVYFPRFIVPISISLVRLINLAVNYALFLSFLCYFLWRGAKVEPNLWILATPLLVLQTVTLAVGIGLFASAFTTRYRDVIQAFGYLMSIWMYATPIIYPYSQVPERFKWLFHLNPMASVVEIFRHGHLGTSSVDLTLWLVNAVIAALVFVTGVIAFNYTEKTVVDTV
jgi:lipopolysaccharide transport system permease protein